MSDLNRGDVVSLSRGQTTKVTINTTGGAGTIHSVTLPINPGDDRIFSYIEKAGDSADDVARGLETALISSPGQSVYSVAVGPNPNDLTIVGPLGKPFSVAVSANLSSELIELSVSAVDGEGRQIGLLRVVQVESTSAKLRSFATRDQSGETVILEDVFLRELGSSLTFDVRRHQILTIVERSNEPRRQTIKATG